MFLKVQVTVFVQSVKNPCSFVRSTSLLSAGGCSVIVESGVTSWNCVILMSFARDDYEISGEFGNGTGS
jgi:hypothetical protein